MQVNQEDLEKIVEQLKTTQDEMKKAARGPASLTMPATSSPASHPSSPHRQVPHRQQTSHPSSPRRKVPDRQQASHPSSPHRQVADRQKASHPSSPRRRVQPKSIHPPPVKSKREVPEVDDIPGFFSPSVMQLIDDALQLEDNAVVGTFDGTNLIGKDIKSLQFPNWLNDNVIDAYLSLIEARSTQPNYPFVRKFSTFFYGGILARGIENAHTWALHSNIFAHEYLFFPIHTTAHWSLVVADLVKGELHYYDSSLDHMLGTTILTTIRAYLIHEYRRVEGAEPDRGFSPRIITNAPQQTNGFDCGVFVCQFAEHISRRQPIAFSQRHMQSFRNTMIWELVTKTLMNKDLDEATM